MYRKCFIELAPLPVVRFSSKNCHRVKPLTSHLFDFAIHKTSVSQHQLIIFHNHKQSFEKALRIFRYTL